MQKYGYLANAEQSAVNQMACVVCDESRPCFSWTDYAGEAYCTRCGTTYQLKWGSEEQEAQGNYPYVNVKKEAIPMLRRYFAETGKMNGAGWVMSLSEYPEIAQGQRDFSEWWKQHKDEYPELAEKQEDADSR